MSAAHMHGLHGPLRAEVRNRTGPILVMESRDAFSRWSTSVRGAFTLAALLPLFSKINLYCI